jgi:hypothetical protein
MKYTNKNKLPDSIFSAITNDGYDHKDDGKRKISVTTLISPPKIRQLRCRHGDEVEVDVSDCVWRLLGSSVHSVVERIQQEESLKEERLELNYGDFTIVGKPDNYYISNNCSGGSIATIEDYKVTSVWSLIHEPEGKAEWKNQLNVYAFLLRNLGFKVDRLQVIVIARDWNKSGYIKDPMGYPPCPLVVVDIEIMSNEEIEKYIRERLFLHELAIDMADDMIPACSAKERWAKDKTYAVYKNKNKRAERVCDDNTTAFAIKKQIEDSKSDYEREKMQERLAKLVGGVAILSIGAATEVEMKEKKDRVDDALHATRAAVAEGIVPGGGTALIRASAALDGLKGDNEDENTGIQIIRRSIEEPLRQIVANAGGEGAVIVQKVREGKDDFGYNARTEQYENLLSSGVIDPTKVVRVALENASSIAGMLLTTECVISDIKEDAHAMPAMPGGGMGGMM